MFDLDTLYKKYLIYRIKKLLPFVLFTLFLVIGGYITYMKFVPLKSDEKTLKQSSVESQKKRVQTPEKAEEKEVKVSKKRVEKKPKKKNHSQEDNKHYKFFTLSVKEKNRSSIVRVQNKYKKLGLECQIENQNNYLNLVCGETNSYKEYKKIKNILEKHHIKYYLVTKKEVPVTDKQKKEKPIQEPKKKSNDIKSNRVKESKKVLKEEPIQNKIVTNMQHSDVDIDLLRKKFLQHENYGIAIRIAKEYYSQKNYKQSLIWAKKANNLDRKKTQSWILYARSLYALGEKEKAIKVLKLYKRFSSSKELNRILQEWEQNDK